MIQKFQQGGPQQGGILAQIQLMPKDLQQQLMQAFALWALLKGLDIKQLLSDPQVLEQALGQFIQEVLSQQTQAARHGAKLNYIKSLKHQCEDDEELYYFKSGGKVGCGCKKKQDGGEIKKAQNGTKATQKFKNDYNSKKVKLSEEDYFNGVSDHNVRNLKVEKQPKKKFLNDYNSKKVKQSEKDYMKGVADHKVKKKEKGSKIEKNCGGSVISKFKAACGKKLNKHQ